MSNALLNQPPKTMFAKVVELYARVTFGTSGAPTLDKTVSRGVLSITRDASIAGKYTVVFGRKVGAASVLDPAVKLASVSAIFNTAGVSGGAVPPVAAYPPAVYANDTADGTKASLVIQLLGPTSTSNPTPVAADPASGEVGHFTFKFIDTTAG